MKINIMWQKAHGLSGVLKPYNRDNMNGYLDALFDDNDITEFQIYVTKDKGEAQTESQ